MATKNNIPQPLNEMARLRKTTTGLPMVVCLNPDDGTSTEPRIKFQDNTNDHINPGALVPMSIDPKEPRILVANYQPNHPSEDIAKLKQWITQNYDALLKYWNGDIWEDELIDAVKPL